MRRVVAPNTTPRSRQVTHPFLRKLGFHESHAWPLRWGGSEVRDGILRAHRHINTSWIARAENAGLRMARRLQPTGLKLVVTVAVERFPELDLLKEVTYRYEVVSLDGQSHSLGEVTIRQDLNEAQRADLAAGKPVAIDPDRVGRIEGSPEVLTDQLSDTVEGLRTEGEGRGRRRQTQRGSRARRPRANRGTMGTRGDRGTRASDRGFGDRGRSPGRGPSRRRGGGGTPTRRPPVSGAGPEGSTQGRVRANGGTPDAPADIGTARPSTPVADVDIPNLRPRVRLSRAVFRFFRGTLVDLVVGLALGLFVSYFERQVQEQTQARVREAWRSRIGPRIETYVRPQIEASAAGAFPENVRIYYGFRWTVVMQELDDELSDAIVWAVRFGAGSPGFGEVYFDVELDEVDILRNETNRPMKGEKFRRERDRRRPDLLRYPMRSWILVHDPFVADISQRLRREVEAMDGAIQQIARTYQAADPRNRLGVTLTGLATDVSRLAFRSALQRLEGFRAGARVDLGDRASGLEAPLDSLSRSIQRAQAMLIPVLAFLDREQRALLETMVGAELSQPR